MDTPDIVKTLRFRRFHQVPIAYLREFSSPASALAYSILSAERRSDSHGHMELSRLARTMGACRNAIYTAKEELSSKGVLKWKPNGEYWIGPPPVPVVTKHSQHFIPIPKKLLAYPKLNISDKVVYGGLAYYAGREGKAYPGVNTLAAKLSMSESTVHRSIRTLKNTGLIRVTEQFNDPCLGHKHRNTSNLYEFYYRELADLMTPVDLLREKLLGRPLQELVGLMRGDLRFFPPEEIVELFDEKLMAHIRQEISPLNPYDISKLAPKVLSKWGLLELPNFDLVGHISPKLWNAIQHLIPNTTETMACAWDYPNTA